MKIQIKNGESNPLKPKMELELDKIRIQYDKYKAGELSEMQNITSAKREDLFKSLLQYEFELVDDSLNELIEKFNTSIIALEHYPDEELRKSFSDHIRLYIGDNFILLNKLFTEIKAASNENFRDFNNPEIKKLVNTASSLAVRRLTLLENLLAWSDAQNKTFNPIKINLRKLVVTGFNRFDTSAEQRNITLDHSIGLLLCVSADELMLKTIFRNLIGNAIEYSNIGGNIFISAKEVNGFVEVEVKDSGKVISQETLEKLFKTDETRLFSDVDNQWETGLGLFISKKFIEMHGGEMQVESEQGTGSSVKFKLPHYM